MGVRLTQGRELLLQCHVCGLHRIEPPLQHTRLMARVAELRLQRLDRTVMLGSRRSARFVVSSTSFCSFAAAPRSRSISSSARFSVARRRSDAAFPRAFGCLPQ